MPYFCGMKDYEVVYKTTLVKTGLIYMNQLLKERAKEISMIKLPWVKEEDQVNLIKTIMDIQGISIVKEDLSQYEPYKLWNEDMDNYYFDKKTLKWIKKVM